MKEIEDGHIVNLLASLVLSLLMSINEQIPAHKRKARAIKKVEEAVRELAILNSLPITDELIEAGVKIWNKCIEELQRALIELETEIVQEEHPELFHYDRNGVCEYTSYRYTDQ